MEKGEKYMAYKQSKCGIYWDVAPLSIYGE